MIGYFRSWKYLLVWHEPLKIRTSHPVAQSAKLETATSAHLPVTVLRQRRIRGGESEETENSTALDKGKGKEIYQDTNSEFETAVSIIIKQDLDDISNMVYTQSTVKGP